ncbi:MAG: type II toxin-antitoxin system Phd/YefM family antitoxin [Firmicutes bacterium]|nr:type II toxin-antitoxin system Phd/YefM family antitoxin [Bacillota bacterium]
MRNVNISNFRKDIFSYVNQALDYNDILNVNTKNGNVIVMSEEDYNGMKETIYLLSVPSMREKLLEGKNEKGVEFDWENELS